MLICWALLLCGCGDKIEPTPAGVPAVPKWQKHTPSPDGTEPRFVMCDSWKPTGNLGEPPQRALYRLDTWTGRAWRLDRLDPKVSDDLAIPVWVIVMEDDDALVHRVDSAITRDVLVAVRPSV